MKPTIYPVDQPWGLQTLQSVAGFVVFYQNSTSKPNQLQEYNNWVCVKSPQRTTTNYTSPYRLRKMTVLTVQYFVFARRKKLIQMPRLYTNSNHSEHNLQHWNPSPKYWMTETKNDIWDI